MAQRGRRTPHPEGRRIKQIPRAGKAGDQRHPLLRLWWEAQVSWGNDLRTGAQGDGGDDWQRWLKEVHWTRIEMTSVSWRQGLPHQRGIENGRLLLCWLMMANHWPCGVGWVGMWFGREPEKIKRNKHKGVEWPPVVQGTHLPLEISRILGAPTSWDRFYPIISTPNPNHPKGLFSWTVFPTQTISFSFSSLHPPKSYRTLYKILHSAIRNINIL